MAASATLFGGMAFSAKLASARLSGPQVAMIRFAIGLVPLLLVPGYRRKALTYQRADLLFYRGFFGGVAVLLYFIAIEKISVGVATLLNYTAPIFSGIISMIFLRERFSPGVLVPLPIALAGVFLVLRAHAPPGELGFGVWEAVGLASAVSSGFAVSAIRAARRSENSWTVYGSFCLLGWIVCAPLALFGWKSPSSGEWGWLAATSLFALGAQLLMTHSLRWIDAMTSGVISQLAVVVSTVLGVVFLGDPVTAGAVIGSVVAIGGIAGVVYVTSGSAGEASH